MTRPPFLSVERLERIYAVLVCVHIATLAVGRGPIAISGALLIAAALALSVARRRLRFSPLFLITVAFVAWCAFTNLLSPHEAPARALVRLTPLLVSLALLQGVPARAADIGFRILLCITCLEAIYGVLQHFTGINFFGASGRTLKMAPDSAYYLATGFQTIHNYLGMTASLWVAVAACLGLDALRRRDRRVFVLALVSLALIALLLLMSYGRAGWVAAFVVLAIAPLVVPVRRGWLVPVALAALAALAVLLDESLRMRLLSIFSLDANQDRAQILEVNLRLVADLPWTGYGFGSYEGVAAPLHRSMFPDRDYWFGAHNDFFQILIETGVIGVVLLVGMFGAFFWEASRRLWGRHRCAEADRWRVAAAFLMAIAFVICGITQTAMKCFEAFSLLSVGFAMATARTPSGDPLASTGP